MIAAARIVEAGWALIEEAGAPLLVRDARVLIEGDRIAGFPDAVPPGVPVLREPGALLLPGLISAHTHVAGGTPTRGIIEGGRSYAAPLLAAEALPDEDLDALTALNMAEMLLSGVTGQVEMSLSLRQAESWVRVAARWGVRGWPGPMVPGIGRVLPIWFREDDAALHGSVPGTMEEIAAAEDFALRHMGAAGGRITPMMAPHATHTHTPETLRAMARAARRLGTGVHLHTGSRLENALTGRLWGRSPARLCAEAGLMEGIFIAAHLTEFDFAEADLMRGPGRLYAHCPSAEGPGGSSQPWPEALAAGIATGIGLDTHCNDMVETIKQAVLMGRTRHRLLGLAGPLPGIMEAVEAATRAPADALGRPDLGRIREGAKADLVLIDVTGPFVGTGALPPEPLNNLLYATGGSVRHVMTDGRWQVRNGRLAVDDPGRVSAEGGGAVSRIRERLGREGWFTPPG